MWKQIGKQVVKRVGVWFSALGLFSSKELDDSTAGSQGGAAGSDPSGASHGSGGAGGGGGVEPTGGADGIGGGGGDSDK